MLDQDFAQSRGLAQANHLIGFETSQYRKRAVVTEQTILQHEFSQRRVKEIRQRIAVQINYKDAATCNTVHLAQNIHDLLVDKVMREERTHDVSKLVIAKRQTQRVATHGADLRKLFR